MKNLLVARLEFIENPIYLPYIAKFLQLILANFQVFLFW